jgi:hypothetical protein
LQQAERLAFVCVYPSPWLLMQLDMLMSLTLARLQQAGCVPKDKDAAYLRSAILSRSIGVGFAAVSFGHRIDIARSAWLSASYWLLFRSRPSFTSLDDCMIVEDSASIDTLPMPQARTLSLCALYFLLSATRACDIDQSFARRLEDIANNAKVTAADAQLMPQALLIEQREMQTALLRRAVGENPEIRNQWLSASSPFSSQLSTLLQTPVKDLTVASLLAPEPAAQPAADDLNWRDLLWRLVHLRREDDSTPEAQRLLGALAFGTWPLAS